MSRHADPDDPARVVAAVHRLSAQASPLVQARALARALGGCLGADEVVIALTGDTVLAWSASGARPDPDARSGSGLGPGLGSGRRDAVPEVTVRPAEAAERLRHRPELRVAVRLLLDDIHAQLDAAAATEAAERTASTIADARMQTAGEMEQQRYQLERDLHDGAQHHMVALQMALAMVEHHLDAGHPDEAAPHLERLRTLIVGTGEVLHTTAAGLLSLPLTDHGLAAALASRLSTMDGVVLDVQAQITGRRYPNEVESAVYLSCLEAVSNAHRHAAGSSVRVSLWASAHGLHFEVADDGPGFDTSGRKPLAQLAARMGSVGGELRVLSRPGEGTRVTGFVAV